MDNIDKKSIDYDRIVEDTLRLVVKKSLELINDQGLPGDHHFYISFDSTYKGVKVPSELKVGDDNEIKIILLSKLKVIQISKIETNNLSDNKSSSAPKSEV